MDTDASNVLFCWIGNTDIEAMGRFGIDQGIPAYKAEALKVLKLDNKAPSPDKFKTEAESSIFLALNNSLTSKNGIPKFSQVILLTNRPGKPNTDAFRDRYTAYLSQRVPAYRGKISIVFVNVDAYDFESVYTTVGKVLQRFKSQGMNPNDFWYNITPGTIAQQTSWILHAKALSTSSHFIQASKHRKSATVCTIPFDINTVLETQASFIEDGRTDSRDVIGHAPSFTNVLMQARRIAPFPVTVLLTGESGTGKEVLASEIHKASGRKGEFVAINCATLSKELGLTELTGYFKGAFTGADSTKPGLLHKANGGTLFLDEIGDCPLEFQAELLRILQPPNAEKPTLLHFRLKGVPSKDDRQFSGDQESDVRIICATNKDLSDPTIFREDLYYRIETIRLRLPSLEERKAETNIKSGIDDIKELADYFLSKCNISFQFPTQCFRRFTNDAYQALRSHKWEGNLRELNNVVKRAVILSSPTTRTITGENILLCLNGEIQRPASATSTGLTNYYRDSFSSVIAEMAKSDIEHRTTDFDSRLSEFKRLYFAAALSATGGNKKEAYTALGVNAKTFSAYLTPKEEH